MIETAEQTPIEAKVNNYWKIQFGGSLMMAVQVLVAVGVIHLIESMVLSPRIIGKIGHLHPVLVIAILLVSRTFLWHVGADSGRSRGDLFDSRGHSQNPDSWCL